MVLSTYKATTSSDDAVAISSQIDLINPKDLLAEALSPVRPQMTELESRIKSYLPLNSSSAEAVVKHVFQSGGKRIRPALYFFCADLMNYRGEYLYPIAAVCEYVHTASLLHDDVVDNSTLRRNKPTASSIWGDQASVLVGDLIYSRASELMAQTGSLQIVETFARAIRLMSEGELLQLENTFRFDASEADYFKVLRMKTAALISAACQSPAFLAEGDASPSAISLGTFGESLGLAFQLIDDALDYLGDGDVFGKPTQSDLLEGKLTMPVILLRERATNAERRELETILSGRVTPTEVSRVSEMIAHYQTGESTVEMAGRYTDDAINALSVFNESEARVRLETIAKRLVWRFS
jgi:octaprenyl-diphosphate synthase